MQWNLVDIGRFTKLYFSLYFLGNVSQQLIFEQRERDITRPSFFKLFAISDMIHTKEKLQMKTSSLEITVWTHLVCSVILRDQLLLWDQFKNILVLSCLLKQNNQMQASRIFDSGQCEWWSKGAWIILIKNRLNILKNIILTKYNFAGEKRFYP